MNNIVKIELPQNMASLAQAGSAMALGFKMMRAPSVVDLSAHGKGFRLNFEIAGMSGDGQLRLKNCLETWGDYQWLHDPVTKPMRGAYLPWARLAMAWHNKAALMDVVQCKAGTLYQRVVDMPVVNCQRISSQELADSTVVRESIVADGVVKTRNTDAAAAAMAVGARLIGWYRELGGVTWHLVPNPHGAELLANWGDAKKYEGCGIDAVVGQQVVAAFNRSAMRDMLNERGLAASLIMGRGGNVALMGSGLASSQVDSILRRL